MSEGRGGGDQACLGMPVSPYSSDERTCAYRLSRGVSCLDVGGGLVLLLSYPLKTIRLHRDWRPVFDRFKSLGRVSFDEICSIMSRFPAEKLEEFLQDLVFRGFLLPEGLPVLPDFCPVSVIVPVRNRPREIGSCLRSLQDLEYPKEKLEVVVVDDASSDNTPDVISSFPVRLVRLPDHRQASFCRNIGAREARGEILAFLDSDCVADPLWLRELLPAFRNLGVGAVGGLVDSFAMETPLERYEQVRSSLRVAVRWERSSRENPFLYIPSCNLLVRRERFLNLGGFRENLHVGEDVDFCWRLQSSGAHLELRPAGRVFHRHRDRLTAFCARRFQYGTSEPLLQRLHPNREKQFTLPRWESLFGVLLLASICLTSPLLLGAACVPFLIGWCVHRRSLRAAGPSIPGSLIALSQFRSTLGIFYHLCAFVSRYYLLWAVVLFPALPLMSLTVLVMHGVAGSVEFIAKKPEMNLMAFLLCYSAEQLAYQLGVWWGCWNHGTAVPVLPRLRFTAGQ